MSFVETHAGDLGTEMSHLGNHTSNSGAQIGHSEANWVWLHSAPRMMKMNLLSLKHISMSITL